MTSKVKTFYFTNFNMPTTCVACGEAAQPGLQWKVTGSKSDWSGKHTTSLVLEFPICEACDLVSRSRRGAKAVTWIGALISLGLCLFGGIMAGSISGNTFLGLGIGFLIAILAALSFTWMAEKINQKGLTVEQRARRKRLLRCARIITFKAPGMFDKTGSVVFQFELLPFALAFSNLNQGKLT